MSIDVPCEEGFPGACQVEWAAGYFWLWPWIVGAIWLLGAVEFRFFRYKELWTDEGQMGKTVAAAFWPLWFVLGQLSVITGAIRGK